MLIDLCNQGVTEELIVEKLSQIGLVLNFRLVYDKETGRPKGFGFAEFADADAAASAVRNLNEQEIMGRKLRVDYSNDGSGSNETTGNNNSGSMTTNGLLRDGGTGGGPGTSSSLPSLPPGTDLPPGVTCPDAISRTLSTLPPPQLLDILSQMKGLVMSDPAKATELLRQAPQLSYAIFQSLLLLGLVDTSVLASVVEVAASAATAGSAPIAAGPPAQAQPQVQFPSQQQAYMPYAPPPSAAPPIAVPPPPQTNIQTPNPFQPYPPHHNTAAPIGGPAPLLPMAPQQQQTQPQQQQQQQPGGVPSKEDLIRQVLAMTPQQIEQLAPEYRAQIVALRTQLMGGGGAGL